MEVESESEVAQSCLTPSYPMDCSLPGSSIHGIFQARVLEWGAIAFSDPLPGDLPNPGIKLESLTSPALAGGFFTTSTTWEAEFFTVIMLRFLKLEYSCFTMLY